MAGCGAAGWDAERAAGQQSRTAREAQVRMENPREEAAARRAGQGEKRKEPRTQKEASTLSPARSEDAGQKERPPTATAGPSDRSDKT